MTVTSDISAPLIVVVGATGAQGSSVIKALVESDKLYRIRGFTRNPGKPAGQSLTKEGVEVIALDPAIATQEEVQRLFSGATYVFVSIFGKALWLFKP